MKTCFLCKREYPTKDVRSWYGLLQHICTSCSAKYRCLKLDIYYKDKIKSLEPVLGATKCKIIRFDKNTSGRVDYNKPILKPFESGNSVEIGSSSETRWAVPCRRYANQNNSRPGDGSVGDLSAGLIDEAPLFSGTRSPAFDIAMDNPEYSSGSTAMRKELSKALPDVREAEDRSCETAERLRETGERLRETEDKLRETEDKLRETEDRLREAEDKLHQSESEVDSLTAEKTMRQQQHLDLRAALDGIRVVRDMWREGSEEVLKLMHAFNEEVEARIP